MTNKLHLTKAAKLLFLLIVSIPFSSLFNSCDNQNKPQSSNYLNEKITSENLIQLSEKLVADNSITVADIDYVNSYLGNFGIYRDSILGKTLGEIITSQKSKDLKNKKIFLSQLSKKTAINHTFAIVLDSITAFDEVGKKPVSLFYYQMANIGNKDLKQVEGFIEFHDAQGTLIKKFGVNMQYNLKAGNTVSQRFPYDFDGNNPRDIYVRENYKNSVIVWVPQKVTFADNSIIDLSL